MIPHARLGTTITSKTRLLALATIAASLLAPQATAKDRIVLNIPLRSKMSPVQPLNREGVEAVKKNQYEKAEALFYKAYLYDPSDPFTLNNLGYVAELRGRIEQAHRYYQLAAEQGCNAPIDLSSMKSLQGKPMRTAFDNLQDLPMRVNRINLDAMRLLAASRGFEAVSLLQQALTLDRQNPFTMNNLAVSYETIGDYEDALRYYTAVADLHSSEHVNVTRDRRWRGKAISQMAQASADRLQKRIQTMPPQQLEAIRYNVRGVFEENRNQWDAAKQDFLRAFSAHPESAFSLNNRAYVAEREGDLETAQFYYQKAWKSQDANVTVGLATSRVAEGRRLFSVANESNHKVDRALDAHSRERRRESAPVQLTPRGAAAESTPNQQNVPAHPRPDAPSPQ